MVEKWELDTIFKDKTNASHMRTLLLLFIAAVSLVACKNEKPESQTVGPAQPQAMTPPPQPIPNTREAQILIRNYWVFEYFIVENNPELSLGNKGKWYKFNPDGTFTAGHWEDFTTKGTWTLYYGGAGTYPVIHVIAENPALTGEYQIQGISGEEDYMSWMGTARYGQKGWAAKVMNLLTAPTRKQFGVDK